MGTSDIIQICIVVLAVAVNVGIQLRGQQETQKNIGELKELIQQIDRDKLDKELHVEVVRRIDGELGGLKEGVSSVRHGLRNLEQRVPFPSFPPGPRG